MFKRLFPFLIWFERYTVADCRSDLVGGVTVALVLVPQSMAYAQLAGLPAYYGLYASFLPPLVAALFGSSRQLATGPVAVVSLMTSTALEPLATAGSSAFIGYAVLLALLVGLFQLALGVLRLGLVVNFLSHPVVSGFTNAAALIIASSQLSKLFGVYVDEAKHHYETVYNVFQAAISYTHWPTLGMAVLAFAIMFVLKRLSPRVPNVLVAVAITTGLSWLTGFERNEKTRIANIESLAVRDHIRTYNGTLARIDSAAAARVSLEARHRETEKTHGEHSPECLREHLDREILGLQIETLKEEARSERAWLRRSQFCMTSDLIGQTTFVTRGSAGRTRNADGRVWRIRVGNAPIDTTAVAFTGGGSVVGTIPRGLPKPRLPRLDLSAGLSLFSMAVVISILGFMEAISIARAMAAKTRQRLDPNQELIGQGLANIAGSLSQGYPVSGSFSRSAVNLQAGSVSGLSNVVSSLVVVVVLMFFTPLLYHLPQAVLAAIIMMAVVGLVNLTVFAHAWRAQKHDGAIALITFAGTLLFAPHLDRGILIGVGLSLGLYLLRNIKPDIALLSRYTDGTYRNAERWRLELCRHVAIVRFNGSLFFASVNYLEEKIFERVRGMPELRHILLVGNGINELDASGEEALSALVDRLREVGIDFSISGLNDWVLDTMRRTGLHDKLGEDHLFRNATLAVADIHERTHLGSSEEHCPLITVRFRGLPVAPEARRKRAFLRSSKAKEPTPSTEE